MAPQIVVDVTPDMCIMQEEVKEISELYSPYHYDIRPLPMLCSFTIMTLRTYMAYIYRHLVLYLQLYP